MSTDKVRLRTRIYRKAVQPLYDTHVHPVRCAWYQRHQEALDDAWLDAESKRLQQVKAARDTAYANVYLWQGTVRTASSKTHRQAAQDELDRYTAMHLAAHAACVRIEAELNRVHARRNRLGTKKRSESVSEPRLVAQHAM